MILVIAIAIASGFVGAWIYAGCPLPRTVPAPLHSHRSLPAERPTTDAVSSAPARGASPARP